MFIKVTGLYTGKTFLVNTDNIYCVAENEGRAEIVYADDSEQAIKESFDEIERMLKGADDEHVITTDRPTQRTGGKV
jgi:hypothetical protein